MSRKVDDSEPDRSSLHTGSLEEGEGEWTGGTTDAASECGEQEPAACVEGRLRTHDRPGHL